MSKEEKGFQPDWSDKEPEKGSYRSIFKWGDPKGFKHPNHKLYSYVKDLFEVDDSAFSEKVAEGRNMVDISDKPSKIDKKHLSFFEKLLGSENISIEDYDRLKFSTGKTQEEAFELRQNKVKEVCDAVLHPRNTEDVAEIIKYCNKNKIPVNTYGGGSSVNFGFRPTKNGITLVLGTHMNKVQEINELNKTAVVDAGMLGPAYEKVLNNAKTEFGTEKNYTNGHFPQSFEYSSVGGWVVTLGSGQESSYYGDATDLVMGVEFVSPQGIIKTHTFPGCANGPKVLDIIKGSEGTLGVVTKLTMKIFNYQPENQFGFAYIFKSFEDGIAACREISQGEFGFPGVMRISDEEESDMGLRLYGVSGTILDTFMKIAGYKENKRCLFLGRTCGEKGFAKNVLKNSKKICKKHGGFSLTSYPLKKWEGGRYADPYLREDLNDYGLVLDTLECGVTWDNLHKVHQEVRKVVKDRPFTGCSTHASHFYPEGTNLYFIFFCKMTDIDEYIELQTRIIDAMCKAGGSLSHHHGVGRMIAPWMEEHLGKDQMEVLKAVKKHFDPNNIMNPGGQLGVDYEAKDLKNYNWRIDWNKK